MQLRAAAAIRPTGASRSPAGDEVQGADERVFLRQSRKNHVRL